jgi:hypothetical protein
MHASKDLMWLVEEEIFWVGRGSEQSHGHGWHCPSLRRRIACRHGATQQPGSTDFRNRFCLLPFCSNRKMLRWIHYAGQGILRGAEACLRPFHWGKRWKVGSKKLWSRVMQGKSNGISMVSQTAALWPAEPNLACESKARIIIRYRYT